MNHMLSHKFREWSRDPNRILLASTIVFLLVHIFLEFWYVRIYSYPMIWINLLSIIFYLALIGVVRQGHFMPALFAIYIEILLHGSLGCLFAGWNSGFQFWIVGLIVAYLFPILSLKAPKKGHSNDRYLLYFGLVSFATYMALYFLHAFGITDPLSTLITSKEQTISNGFNSAAVLLAVMGFTAYFLSNLRGVQENLRMEARHDPLTGLYNRYALTQVVQENFLNADAYGDYLCLCIADIDFFKKVNDTYGHDAGDAVLKGVANIILSGVGDGVNYAARWGGEEFIMISAIRPEKMRDRMEDFRKQVSKMCINWEGQEIRITISVGGSTYKSGMDYDTLLKEADDNLYYVKQHGRNAVRISTHGSDVPLT